MYIKRNVYIFKVKQKLRLLSSMPQQFFSPMSEWCTHQRSCWNLNARVHSPLVLVYLCSVGAYTSASSTGLYSCLLLYGPQAASPRRFFVFLRLPLYPLFLFSGADVIVGQFHRLCSRSIAECTPWQSSWRVLCTFRRIVCVRCQCSATNTWF